MCPTERKRGRPAAALGIGKIEVGGIAVGLQHAGIALQQCRGVIAAAPRRIAVRYRRRAPPRLARLRTGRLALRDNRYLLRHALTAPSRCPRQEFHATKTVPINWQITWHTIPLPRSDQAGSPHPRHPAQRGGRLRLHCTEGRRQRARRYAAAGKAGGTAAVRRTSPPLSAGPSARRRFLDRGRSATHQRSCGPNLRISV
jgi:hypothetical protein